MRTKGIHDHNLRAAAELIDRVAGKKGDHDVTAADLAKAQALVEKKHAGAVVKELTPLQLDVVEKALPQLRALVDADTAKKPSSLTPYATGLWTTAIADPKVRGCAEAIAKALGDGEHLQLGRFLDARDALNGVAPHGREDRVAVAAEKLKAAIAAGVVDPASMDALNVFFLEGDIGGIMSHGPVHISGIPYDDVYRLPVDAPAKKDAGVDYAGAIETFEHRFRDLAYDRIYIQGKDGELYVALQKSGKLKKVDEGYQVSMRDETNEAASGKVLKVVDIANSFSEATWRPWVDGLVHAADVITSGFKKGADTAIEKATGRVVDELTDPSDREKRMDLKSMGVAMWATGTTAAAAFNLPVVLGLLAVGAVGITGASVLSWLQKSDDISPIFHAMGVTVNRPDEVSA